MGLPHSEDSSKRHGIITRLRPRRLEDLTARHDLRFAHLSRRLSRKKSKEPGSENDKQSTNRRGSSSSAPSVAQPSLVPPSPEPFGSPPLTAGAFSLSSLPGIEETYQPPSRTSLALLDDQTIRLFSRRVAGLAIVDSDRSPLLTPLSRIRHERSGSVIDVASQSASKSASQVLLPLSKLGSTALPGRARSRTIGLTSLEDRLPFSAKLRLSSRSIIGLNAAFAASEAETAADMLVSGPYESQFRQKVPPTAEPSDTYVSFITKLLEEGFAYDAVDLISAKIPILKYGPELEFKPMIDSTPLLLKTLAELSQEEFYTNCLYVYTYLCFLDMHYGQGDLFVQSLSEGTSPHPAQTLLESISEGLEDRSARFKSFLLSLQSPNFLDHIVTKVSAIPIDLVFRHFMFYHKLPQETEKIDLVLETVGYNYYYFTHLQNLKAVYKQYQYVLEDEAEEDDGYDTTVVLHRDLLGDSTDSPEDQNVLNFDASKYTIFNSVNEVYTLLFVMLALQTDHFNRNNKTKMSPSDFANIVKNFQVEDFKKVRETKAGAKISETDDSCLLFNLLTSEMVLYFYENITSTPLRSVVEVLGAPGTPITLMSPTSPSFGVPKKRSNLFFSNSVFNDPYRLTVDDLNRLTVAGEPEHTDPFKQHYGEFIEICQSYGSRFLENVLNLLNSKSPDSVMRLDHSQEITDMLFKVKQATIRPNGALKDKASAKTIRKLLLHGWPQGEISDDKMSVFVRIFKIGVIYKQESRLSLIPKRTKKKNKSRSKNFSNGSLNDSDLVVWRKYYAILTTFGLYIFKNISWDVLKSFQEELDMKEQNKEKVGHIKVYLSSFFLQSSGSELELAIPIDKIFAYHNKYKEFNSFYICYNSWDNDSLILKVDEVELANDWMSNPKANRVYNKGLFYCDTKEDADEWVHHINYLAALYKSLPVTGPNDTYTSLSLPSYENVYELTIARHMSLTARHRELQMELKIIRKLRTNYERVVSFARRLAPHQTKTRSQLRKMVHLMYTNNLRSLWFEELKTRTFAHIVEQTISRISAESTKKDLEDVLRSQRQLRTILMRKQQDPKYMLFSQVADRFSTLFLEPLIRANDSYLNDSRHNSVSALAADTDSETLETNSPQISLSRESFIPLATQPNLEFDSDIGLSPVFRATHFKQLL